MLRRLLALLRPTRSRNDVGQEIRTTTSVEENNFDLSLVERLCEPSAENAILAGSLQLIGLDDVRDGLGTVWNHVADRVNRMSQEEIRARLSERDTFRICNNHTYLICFSDGDERLAARTAAEISAGIRKRI